MANLIQLICPSCNKSVFVDLNENSKQELSEHLKSCIAQITYQKLDPYTLEIPFSKVSIGQTDREDLTPICILSDCKIDYERRIVIVKMIK